jgi:D-alanyl-D-alanine dipeptidase
MSDEIVLIADPRVLAMTIADNSERLVDLRKAAPLVVDQRKGGESSAYFYCRQGILERLMEAQRLLPKGFRLMIVEAYRSPDLQRKYFNEYLSELTVAHPSWTADQLTTEATKFVAPPDWVPPHCTGGAVDLTIVDKSGTELDMGTVLNASPEESDGRCFTNATSLSPVAVENRATLIAVMTAAGFVNYPTEWWHWSYGDRYWAFADDAAYAIYGLINEPL